MKFATPKDVLEYSRERREAYRSVLGELERRITMDVMYYGGMQWGRYAADPFSHAGGVARIRGDINPDSQRLRVTFNRTTLNVQRAAVTTFPQKIEAEVFPPDRDCGIESVVRAQVLEDALGVVMDAANYHAVRCDVNFQRSIWSSYGVLIQLRRKAAKVHLYGSATEVPSTEIKAQPIDPTRLVLDPYNGERDLREHEFVEIRSVWTARKIREMLGIKAIDEDRLMTIGKLCPFQMGLNRITDNQMFGQYRAMSETKGAVVSQLHLKDDSGRHGLMFVTLEMGDEEPRVINFDDPYTPFGGCGLPVVLFHGHRRTDGPWGISDVSMMKDNQDRLNLAETWKNRHSQRNAGFQFAVDRNSMGRNGKEDEEFKSSLSNTVGGTIFYNGGTRDRPGSAPQLVKYPDMNSSLLEMARQYEDAMLDDVHRARVNTGETKSHVPFSVHQAALEQADQVLGARVFEDVKADNQVLDVMLGTLVKCVKEYSPCTLGLLRSKHFDESDLAILFDCDPVRLDCDVKVREGSVRYRSPESRRAELRDARDKEVITAAQYRMAMVRDTDTPLTNDDKFFQRRSDRIALDVVAGAEWTPVDMGEYGDWLLAAFRRARLDRAATENPETAARLDRAIMGQVQIMAQHMGLDGGQTQDIVGTAGAPPGVVDDGSGAALESVMSALEGRPAA